MTSIATGIFKEVRAAKQSGIGVVAATSGGQKFRRVSSTLDISKQIFSSNEIRTDQQIADLRHGTRQSAGSLSGELSPLTYKGFMESMLRSAFSAGVTTGPLTTISATAATGGAAGTFGMSSGSFITDGFKIGDVVRAAGFTSGSSGANNNRNLRITGLTASTMTIGTIASGAAGQPEALVTASAGDTVTLSVVGKKLMCPLTGLTNDYWTVEHWFSDIVQSEVYTDIRIASMTVSLPASGMATIEFALMGRDIQTGSAVYFTSPTAITTSRISSGITGRMSVAGVDYGTVTSLTLQFTGSYQPGDPVLGSVSVPDIFPGSMVLTGQATVYFSDTSLRDAFLNETEVNFNVLATVDTTLNSDFISFNIPRAKVNGNQKTDGRTGLIQSVPFQALLNINGGTGTATDETTLSIQDSMA